MAFFLRTRRLDISRLERKPQENLGVVHSVLTSSIGDVVRHLQQVEHGFYGGGKSTQAETRRWARHISAVLKAVRVPSITSIWQIDDVTKRAADPRYLPTIDTTDINKYREFHRKIADGFPHRFLEIVVELKKILKYVEKYCLSFYETVAECEEKLDTAKEYEEQRVRLSAAIRSNMERISLMGDYFTGRGLQYEDLSLATKELARKTGSSHIMSLLIVPEASEILREVIHLIKTWIEADTNYATFIRNDIKDMEIQKATLAKEVQDLHAKFHQVNFKMKQSHTTLEQRTNEMVKLFSKEEDLLVEEELMINETNEMQLEIEMKQYRQDELIKSAAHMHPDELIEKFAQISEELRELKMRLPFAKRKLENVRRKLVWITQKKGEIRALEADARTAEKEVSKSDARWQEKEKELFSVSARLEMAQRLYLYKTSVDAIRKIFYDQPVGSNSNRLPGPSDSDDPFDRACRVVALSIENDWPRLYRNLPFHPYRGNSTIDADIALFAQQESRVGVREAVTRCLRRWRRFHTRARLEDLQETLARLRRHDVLGEIEADLNPVVEQDNEQEPDYSFIDPSLIPFLKEVERFDQLRAANRI